LIGCSFLPTGVTCRVVSIYSCCDACNTNILGQDVLAAIRREFKTCLDIYSNQALVTDRQIKLDDYMFNTYIYTYK